MKTIGEEFQDITNPTDCVAKCDEARSIDSMKQGLCGWEASQCDVESSQQVFHVKCSDKVLEVALRNFSQWKGLKLK